MTDPTRAHSVLFADLFGKPVVATFDREQASSDGGAILLKAADRVYGLVKTFARCLVDGRAPEKIRHTFEDLVGQRVLASPAGIPMATMRTGSPTTRSTSCCWGATRWPARAGRRSRRSRASRTTRAASRSIGWGPSWQDSSTWS